MGIVGIVGIVGEGYYNSDRYKCNGHQVNTLAGERPSVTNQVSRHIQAVNIQTHFWPLTACFCLETY